MTPVYRGRVSTLCALLLIGVSIKKYFHYVKLNMDPLPSEVSDKYYEANISPVELTHTAVSNEYNRRNVDSSHINLSRKDSKFTKETPPGHLSEATKRGRRESSFNISSLSSLFPDEHNIEQGSNYLAKKNTPSSSGVNLRIAFCIFGVVARAIEWTWPSIDSQLIEPLEKAGFNITIYVFNLQVGSTKVDNNYLNSNAYRTIYSPAGRHIVYEEEDQSASDIAALIRSVLETPGLRLYSSNSTSVNALRKMYSEMRVGQYLQRNLKSFDLAIATSADHGYMFPIPVNVVREAASLVALKTVYLGAHLVSGKTGIDDGFYMGRPDILANFMQRFNAIPGVWLGDLDFTSGRTGLRGTPAGLPAYEVILNRSITYHNFSIRETPMIAFYKIRSDGWVQVVGQWFLGKQEWMSEENRTFALTELARLKQVQTLRPGLEASKERLNDLPLALTKPAEKNVREAAICSFGGDLRELPPSQRKTFTDIESEGRCSKHGHWRKSPFKWEFEKGYSICPYYKPPASIVFRVCNIW